MDISMNKINCAGECPKCRSEDVQYHENQMDDSSVTYPATCRKCKTNFEEVYILEYYVTQWEEDVA